MLGSSAAADAAGEEKIPERKREDAGFVLREAFFFLLLSFSSLASENDRVGEVEASGHGQ